MSGAREIKSEKKNSKAGIAIGAGIAAGAVLADVWVDGVSMPVIDSLGDEFINYVKDGMKITVQADGVVCVE